MDVQIILNVLSHMRQLRQRDLWTRKLLEAYQADALRSLRDYAYAHSPFYQAFHQGLTDAPLQELPVLTKAMLMEHFDDLVTDRAIRLEEVKKHVMDLSGDKRYLGRYRVNATSGSSGHPGIFLFNRAEWIAVLASFARAREWGSVKMATGASSTSFHMSAQVNETAHSWWMPELHLAASRPIEVIVERLNSWQPEVLIAYASMARILADEQLAGRLQISPRAVFTSSEMLTQETRRRTVQAWGERIFNQYAATECGSLAAECEHHRGMHLMEDLVIFEVVDQSNRPVPPGAYGDKLLITMLGSRTQPLIRYELDDSVRLASAGLQPGHGHAPGEWLAGHTRGRWSACLVEWRSWRVERRNARRYIASSIVGARRDRTTRGSAVGACHSENRCWQGSSDQVQSVPLLVTRRRSRF
jgi:phenylacetate-coenzyme A ligase PaaK-like adenylate-forming protein